MIIISINIHSQVCVGNADYFNEKSNKNTNEEINNFKKTITVVALPEKQRNEFNKIIKENWNITNVEFVSLSEFEKNKEKYVFPTYSYIKFDNFSIIKKEGNINSWNFLNLNIGYSTIKNLKKNGKSTFEDVSLATVYFSPILNFKYKRKDYSSGNSIVNYEIGFFKNYIQFLNSSIKNNENFNCLDEFINKEKLKELKTKKLYILQKVYENFQVKLNNDIDPEIEDLLSKYEYDYELISSHDLQKKILDNNEDFYYFMYSQINSKKVLTIINSKTGEIIYNYMNRMSEYIKKSDFKQISEEIKKL